MNSYLHAKILTALRLSLRPLARLLLRHGITYGQFAEVAKDAFVEEVLSERDQRGRQTNKSRIAIRTGLSRKEVARIRERVQVSGANKNGEAGLTVKIGSAARVLQLWHVEAKFLDDHGQPKGLVFAGEDISFSSLVKLVGGDIPPGALRAELIEAKAVTELLSPLTGVVVKFHTELTDNPEKLNSTDKKDNWILEVKDVEPDAFKKLSVKI
jgi:hypothetical protein